MSSGATARWLDVWTRAVIVPAWRRASAVWVGCAIVAGLVFGGNGMAPGDLTAMALHHAPIAAMLAAIWLLVFVPTARLLLRADGAIYLRSLPGPTVAPRLLAGAALIALQLPWLLLWVIGEGAAGLLVVASLTVAIAILARWRPPVMRSKWPGWRTGERALRSIHLRALRRRAADALVRGAGLSLLAGAAGGLFVRNNQLAGEHAATVGASVIAVVLVPAEVGVLMVILATHRSTAWLAHSLGISRATRIAAVFYAILVVQLVATAIAIGAAALVSDADRSTVGWLAAVSGVVAIGSSLGCTRVLIAAESSPTIAARAAGGATGVAALGVLCLGLFDVYGAIAMLATCMLALFVVPEERA